MKNLICFLFLGLFIIACTPTPSAEVDTPKEDNVIEVPSLSSMEGKHCFLETLKYKMPIIHKNDTIYLKHYKNDQVCFVFSVCFCIFDPAKAKGNGRRDEEGSNHPANAPR